MFGLYEHEIASDLWSVEIYLHDEMNVFSGLKFTANVLRCQGINPCDSDAGG